MTRFIIYLRINLFNKISVSGNDLVQGAAEPVAGEGDLLPRQVHEHLHDLCNQGLLSVVGGIINIRFSNAPDIIVKEVAVWAARGTNLLVSGGFRWLRSFLPSPTVVILSPST